MPEGQQVVPSQAAHTVGSAVDPEAVNAAGEQERTQVTAHQAHDVFFLTGDGGQMLALDAFHILLSESGLGQHVEQQFKHVLAVA